jgi:hypothetical protein
MVPPYLAKIEDLGPGDLAKVDYAACSHTARSSGRVDHVGEVRGVTKPR